MFEEDAEVLELELVLELLPVETIVVIFLSSRESEPKSCWIVVLAFFSSLFSWNFFGLSSG